MREAELACGQVSTPGRQLDVVTPSFIDFRVCEGAGPDIELSAADLVKLAGSCFDYEGSRAAPIAEEPRKAEPNNARISL